MFRYEDEGLVVLKKDGKYAKILENRNVSKAHLKTTSVIKPIDYIKEDETVYEDKEVWRANSKLWSLAERSYGNGRYYWVIGLYNQKPTDAHWKPGDVVLVPHPVEYVISMMQE